MFIGIYECLWVFMGVCVLLGVYGYLWRAWVFMGIYESMGIMGISE